MLAGVSELLGVTELLILATVDQLLYIYLCGRRR